MRGLIFLCGIVWNLMAFSQDSTMYCSQYKTGHFYTVSGTDTCFIRRTEDRQYEKCGEDTTETIFIVVWLKPNKYILRDILYNPSTAKRVMHEDAVMTIMERHDNYYRVHVKMKGQKKKYFNIYCDNTHASL